MIPIYGDEKENMQHPVKSTWGSVCTSQCNEIDVIYTHINLALFMLLHEMNLCKSESCFFYFVWDAGV